MTDRQLEIPEPRNWGTFDEEPFEEYLERWPVGLSHIPTDIIETWIHRHWREFQVWLPLNPFEWNYELLKFGEAEVMSIGHNERRMDTLRNWGDDLFDGTHRESTWLGGFMLKHGTTPAPIIVLQEAGEIEHPLDGGQMIEPYQIVEGHMRLAYLQAMFRRKYSAMQASHDVYVATLPD